MDKDQVNSIPSPAAANQNRTQHVVKPFEAPTERIANRIPDSLSYRGRTDECNESSGGVRHLYMVKVLKCSQVAE